MTYIVNKKKITKKGSFFDVIGIIVGSAIIIILFIAMGIAYNKTGDTLEYLQLNISIDGFNESSQILIDQANKYPVFWDFLIAFMIFALFITAFISAYILGNNPIFLTIYVVLSLVGLVVGSILEFALEDIFNNVVLTPFVADYPISLFIVNNFLLFSIFFIIGIGIALYMKPGDNQ